MHSAEEELPLSQLARVKVGPYYTNTLEGLAARARSSSGSRKI